MKKKISNALFFILLMSLFSCQEKSLNGSQYNEVAQQVEQLRQIVSTPANGDSLLKNWKALDTNPIIKNDTLLAARVKYNIGRLYGMAGKDSAKFYVEDAMELLEPTKGNLEDKARNYNGMGNIWSEKSKEHQANYYYNKAATIVLSDSTLTLSPLSKTIMLLSAAQSNSSLFQYDLAQQMNKAALALVPQLPPGHINRQRPLVQIIQTMSALHESPDSMKVYLNKIEALHRENPDDYEIGFLYECKNKYFKSINQNDSLLHYLILKCKMDEEAYLQYPLMQTRINNLFISYTNIAGTYILLKKGDMAQKNLQKAKELLEKNKNIISEEHSIIYKNNLAALYELQGKSAEALHLMYQAFDLQKNNYQTENTQAVAEMNALYQLQAKDRSIQTLNENVKINQLQLQQNRLWLALSILTIVLLGITLLFLYYTNKLRREGQEKEKVLLQHQLLRTQMEPHFIFNTLSAVQSFIRLDNKENAIKYLNRFSQLLRSSLELSRENFVSLDDEIEMLENYLVLQQMRFENVFSYHILYPHEHDFSEIMVPPMLIQPFVENALLHGIDLDNGLGNVDISFELKEDILRVTITDSGKEKITQDEPMHRSLSRTISQERVHLLGKKASITTQSTDHGGTIVVMHIPLVYA
ncbi:histidine kinase [Sphingobacterium sp. SRCM116780]|uniref:histidine kinase n=1 Tax=Sphingobacterium sp. SRCM116780 TaxID=2907623 RepID=UPI001F2AE01E|nr:histidine kinase [Sphingobacterium sp. SRCM116780]UIR54914.1 histidine kinase [Sphingobacterium sp. SRCM116780]